MVFDLGKPFFRFPEDISPPTKPQLTGLPQDIPKEFWCGNAQLLDRAHCCFNHYIGLPEKDGVPKPLHDYEEYLFTLLQKHEHTAIKKATGLGISEFFLRYMSWLCLKDDTFKDCQMCIVTGPRIELAVTLIQRTKDLFRDIGMRFDTKETVVELNGCHIEAYPSHHVDDMRGLTNVKFILIDEFDFLPLNQQEPTRDACERYIAKSNVQIAMISTPNVPGGIMERIWNELNCIYHRITWDYTVGLDKIYTEEEIAKAKQSASFEREYGCKYGYGIGNVFIHDKIELSIKEFEVSLEHIRSCSVSIGVDPGFGSSRFGIVVTVLHDGIIKVIEAEQHEKADFNIMVNRIFDLRNKYEAAKVYVDGSQPSFIRALKTAISEDPEYDKYISIAAHDKVKLSDKMSIVPVNFNQDGRIMLTNMQSLVSSETVWIPKIYDELITEMRMAKEKNGLLDKSSNTMDLLDAFRLALFMFYMGR